MISISRRLLNASIATLLIGCTIYCAAEQSAQDVATEGNNRSRLELSSMISFDEFKLKFHKNYNSILEEISRRRLYIGHAIESVTSKLAYKIKLRNWYKSVNHMSDWSVAQFRRTLMRPNGVVDNAKTAAEDKESAVGAVLTRLRALEKLARPDEIHHDHRDCMTVVKDQGSCGSCYMFSVTALYEWMYCKQTGVKQSFSEQYAIDCGNHGCAGGLISETINFFKTFGFYTRDSYPYFARKKRCLFHARSAEETEKLGQIRVTNVEKSRLDLNGEGDNAALLAEQLDEGPVLVTIHLNEYFYQYGGGVDDAMGCAEEIELHSVVLVGDGVENGNEYWLMRNSHGPDWGENGYYKMNKKATERCLSVDSGSGITIQSGYVFETNTKHDSSVVDKMLPVWLERLASKETGKSTKKKN